MEGYGSHDTDFWYYVIHVVRENHDNRIKKKQPSYMKPWNFYYRNSQRPENMAHELPELSSEWKPCYWKQLSD